MTVPETPLCLLELRRQEYNQAGGRQTGTQVSGLSIEENAIGLTVLGEVSDTPRFNNDMICFAHKLTEDNRMSQSAHVLPVTQK